MSTLGKSLKVVERERFFDDSFFREAWEDFDRAMQSVLDKFDNTGLKVDEGSRTQCQDAYSKIRSSKIDDDLYASQAVQINEKEGKFQAVMDVKDFNPRELQVRAVDDRIVVEGSYQKVSEDGSSSSCKTFYREFALPPAADIDHVATALSKDGILTIRAPKKEGYVAVGEGPRHSSSNNSNTSSSVQQSSSFGDTNSSIKSSSSRKVTQSSSSLEGFGDGFDSLPREMREKLMFCDSGFGSTKTSTCSSPAPSEAGSESSRVSSTMEFDLAKKGPMRTEVAFNVSSPSQAPPSQPPSYQQQPPQPAKFQPTPPEPQQFQQQPNPQFQQQPQQQQFQPPPQPQFQQQQQPQFQPPPQSPPYQQQPQSPPFSPPPPSQFQSPPPPSQYQSPPPPSQFQSPPPPSQFQSPLPQSQFQSPPQSPPFQQPAQGQFQQFPQQPQSQFQFQQPPFMSPQSSQQMFQQFPQFGGQACQPMPPNAPQPVWEQTPSVAVGSSKQSNVNISEKNGRRVLTSQTSNVVQEKDGFMEHRETAAEITDKDSQAARREASSKMNRKEEDPKGKFKRTESADAAEVSESCVQQMPDGSVMSVKKNSTSTSSFKQSFSSTSGEDSFFQPLPNFPSGFGDLRNLMGRGQNLMSQMSTDSMGSTLSGRSGFSDMSNFSQFSDTSSQFSDRSNFSNMSNFPEMGQMNMNRPQPQQQQQPQFPAGPGNMGPQTFSNSSFSSNSNTFNKSSFSSNFGDGNF